MMNRHLKNEAIQLLCKAGLTADHSKLVSNAIVGGESRKEVDGITIYCGRTFHIWPADNGFEAVLAGPGQLTTQLGIHKNPLAAATEIVKEFQRLRDGN